tara:strand:+ start:5966 stop:7189 length:1224 start_codon:yes stop_codon:yes gene_type:complete
MSNDNQHRVKGRLRLSNSKLSWLLEITNSINNNSSKDVLFKILKSVLTEELHIGKFVLFTFQGTWGISLIEGLSEKSVKINIQQLESQFQSIEVLTSHKDETLSNFDVVIPVFHKDKALAYLLLADFDGEKIEVSPIIKHLRFIQTLANIIVVALENKRLNIEHIKQIAIKKELELAQKMQSLLFPRTLPKKKSIEVMAYYSPHSEVGGDYYDVIQLSNGNTALCVADVSGKGVSAAILMANFQANLRARLSITQNLKELVEHCNLKVIESANYEKFITLFIAIFNPNERSLEYLNAGHPPGMLISGKDLLNLDKGCTVLGMFDQLPEIASEKIQLKENSKLFCFSDGLSEMEDEKGICFDDNTSTYFKPTYSLEQSHAAITEKVEKVANSIGLSDDITFLLARFLG